MVELQEHPAAALFPMMPADRFDELRTSIAENGQRHPIVVHEGKIIDGRNRYRACVELGRDPITVDLRDATGEESPDPWLYAWDCNGQRRDIPADQRYLIWKREVEGSDRFQAEIRARKAAANRARSESQSGVSKVEAKERARTSCAATSPHSDVGREEKARASSTNRGAVERMDRLDRERPDLAEKVVAGELKPTQALREMKRGQVADKVAALPDGKHRVIYADPPWKYGDERNMAGYDESAAAGQYPTMSKDELCALNVKSLAADDAVLFCWATFPLLPDALEVVKAWGFKYKTAIVWAKGRANLGNYHNASAELLVIATRGSCTPDATSRPDQVQAVKREGRHSEKPEQFRSLIDALYVHGPRIELFRRGAAPEGWIVWGNEADAA